MSTFEDRLRAVEAKLAVHELMARYHNAVDGWTELGTHKDPEAIAALFTDDGVWDVTARQPAPKGHAEIAALAVDLQAVPWVIHTVVNPIVDIDGREATAEFKGLLRVRRTPSNELEWSIGRYRLLARSTSDGWRIARLSWEPMTARERFEPKRE
jgi:ketosteroid isomerase-like protein